MRLNIALLLFYITHNAFVLSEAVFITKNSTLLQRINRRRPKPKFFKSTSGSSSVEYSADVEDTGVRLHVMQNSLTGYNQHLISPFNKQTGDENLVSICRFDLSQNS